MKLLKYTGIDLNKPHETVGTYGNYQKNYGGEFFGVDGDHDGDIDYDIYVKNGTVVLNDPITPSEDSRKIFLTAIRAAEADSPVQVMALKGESAIKAFKEKNDDLFNWASSHNAQLYLIVNEQGEKYTAYKKPNGETKIYKFGAWRDPSKIEKQEIDNADLSNPKAVKRSVALSSRAMEEYIKRAININDKDQRQALISWAKTNKIPLYQVESKDGTNYIAYTLKGRTIIGKQGKWDSVNAEEFNAIEEAKRVSSNDDFKASKNVLPLTESGYLQYPKSHSVFTLTSQHCVSRSYKVNETDINQTINTLDYRSLKKGSQYIASVANSIREAKPEASLYDILEHVSKQGNIPFALPLYRMNIDKSREKNKDFEVLIITGRGFSNFRNKAGLISTDQEDERRFLHDAKVIEHSISNSENLKEKCKKIQHLANPSPAEIEAAIAQRAQSARQNGRQLMIVYSGHGRTGSLQAGLTEPAAQQEGSMNFVYDFGNNQTSYDFTENDFKGLLQKYLSDIETIHVIHGCHSGAAITATEPVSNKDYAYA